MIFQDALSSLNPTFPVGWQIAEMFREHRRMNKSDAYAQAVRLMERVSIPAAKQRVRPHPHQFSGGMRQRIMIAMAIALDLAVLIADEPTTALDVTVQAQIMGLLQELQEERQMGLILITHDLGVVADVADRIAVMPAGSSSRPMSSTSAPARRIPIPRACWSRSRASTSGSGVGGHRWPATEPDANPVGLRLNYCVRDGAGHCRTERPHLRGRSQPVVRLPLLQGGARCLRSSFKATDLVKRTPSRAASCGALVGQVKGQSTASASELYQGRRSAWWASPLRASRRSGGC